MEKFLVLVILFSSCRALTHQRWEQWKTVFGKQYKSAEEEQARKEIWINNVYYVEEHNNRAGVTFRLSLNQFADQISPNRQQFHIPYVGQNSVSNGLSQFNLPPSFDWRNFHVVSPVRDQGETGTSLGFTATDAVESYTAIHQGHLYNLSVKQFDQCCSTHLLGNAFRCIHDMGGLCQASVNFTSCSNPGCRQIQIDGGADVKQGNETDLQLAVLRTPVMVAVDASHTSFQLYTSGVYNEPNCSPNMLDHTLLLVGYGVDSTGDQYWICKNSWGVNWGMNGYILMSRNKHNQCGIATSASYPV